MPHDVTMPQLGMAQDAGRIVAWLKAPGDPVSRGDALLEVETDKATMEVEAQADGFLTQVSAQEGDDVPVGHVIARISQDADNPAPEPPSETPAAEAPQSDALPEGRPVTMPQLGMAQDSGRLVAWLRKPGEPVAADDPLFEVETDKSTMEVPAGVDGFLAATLAEDGEDVPVGDIVAIISPAKPDAPVARGRKPGTPPPAITPPAAPVEAKADTPGPAGIASPVPVQRDGRVLASPKMRRLARQEGLDIARLAAAGHPQPFHVSDLEALRAICTPEPTTQPMGAVQHLRAEASAESFMEFLAWARSEHGLTDIGAHLAGFAAQSLNKDAPIVIGVERHGAAQAYRCPPGRSLSAVEPTDQPPALLLRDLRETRLRGLQLGAGAVPVLTLTAQDGSLTITLECTAAQLAPDDAIALLTGLAGRIDDPLRHLL